MAQVIFLDFFSMLNPTNHVDAPQLHHCTHIHSLCFLCSSLHHRRDHTLHSLETFLSRLSVMKEQACPPLPREGKTASLVRTQQGHAPLHTRAYVNRDRSNFAPQTHTGAQKQQGVRLQKQSTTILPDQVACNKLPLKKKFKRKSFLTFLTHTTGYTLI